MEDHEQRRSRDRGIWTVRLLTAGGVGGALGLSWAFAGMAEAYFSGRPAPQPPPPQVPAAAAPVQQPRPVVTTVVHHPAGARASGGGSVPRPAGSAPVAAPRPPAAPVCHSTPSKPC